MGGLGRRYIRNLKKNFFLKKKAKKKTKDLIFFWRCYHFFKFDESFWPSDLQEKIVKIHKYGSLKNNSFKKFLYKRYVRFRTLGYKLEFRQKSEPKRTSVPNKYPKYWYVYEFRSGRNVVRKSIYKPTPWKKPNSVVVDPDISLFASVLLTTYSIPDLGGGWESHNFFIILIRKEWLGPIYTPLMYSDFHFTGEDWILKPRNLIYLGNTKFALKKWYHYIFYFHFVNFVFGAGVSVGVILGRYDFFYEDIGYYNVFLLRLG